MAFIRYVIENALRDHEKRMVGSELITERYEKTIYLKEEHIEAIPKNEIKSQIVKEGHAPETTIMEMEYRRVTKSVPKKVLVEKATEHTWNKYKGEDIRTVLWENIVC